MAAHTLSGLLRATLTVVGISALAVSAPLSMAHADPAATDLDARITQAQTELTTLSARYDKIHADLTSTKAVAASVAAKLAPIAATAQNPGTLQVDTRDLDISLLGQFSVRAHGPATEQRERQFALAGAQGELGTEKTRLDALITDRARQDADLAGQKAAAATRAAQLVAERDAAKAAQAAKDAQDAEDRAAADRASRSATRTPSTTTPNPANNPAPPAVSGKAGVAVSFAYAQLGKPYVFGAAGPGSYDCSGLTMAAWGAAGVSIGGHLTNSQYSANPHVDRGQLQPGDLVFFYGLGHVGIYVGGGNVIHAPQPGENVKITSVDAFGDYAGAARPRG